LEAPQAYRKKRLVMEKKDYGIPSPPDTQGRSEREENGPVHRICRGERPGGTRRKTYTVEKGEEEGVNFGRNY